MSTAFKQAIALCGLSQTEAAYFLGVRLDTVKSWSAGRNPVPGTVWGELGELYGRMVRASEEALDLIEEFSEKYGDPCEIDITASGARGDQWPSQGCALAVEGMVRLQISKSGSV